MSDFKTNIYETKGEIDFLDLVELLKEIQKDTEKNDFKFDSKKDKEFIRKYIFNPLMQDYFSLKEAYTQLIEIDGEELAHQKLENTIKELLRKNPQYKQALEYVLWSEENKLKQIAIAEEDEETLDV